MSTFTIYLPPRTLAPLPLNGKDKPYAPLIFQKLVPPREDESISFSLPGGHINAAGTLPALGESDAAEGKKRKRNSKDDLSRNILLLAVNQSDSRRRSIESDISQESSRRRSKRLTRASGDDSLMPTLPNLAASASIMSLNTTNSNPSQFAGNDTTLRLPTWHIPLSRLTSLSTLTSSTRPGRKRGWEEGKQLISLIVCVMSVDSPVCRRCAEERAKGLPGTLWIGGWKVTSPPAGTDDAPSAGVKLWDKMAQEWGDDVVRKGDIVLLEDVEWKEGTSKDPAHISISSTPGSSGARIQILFRTLPRYTSNPYAGQSRAGPPPPIMPEDLAFRPDLRLGRSDPGVRKVAEVARWFADWVGGVGPE